MSMPGGEETTVWGAFKHLRESNKNVQATMLFFFTFSVCRGLWMRQILTTFIFERSHGNLSVGVMSSVSGVVELCVAPFAGWAADRISRTYVLRRGVVFGAASIAAAVIAFWADTEWLMYVAMGLWGAFTGCSMASANSLFADSVRSGMRSALYSLKFSLTFVGNALGPLLDIAFFLASGDTWGLEPLRVLLVCGNLLMVVPVLSLLMFSDNQALGEASEALPQRSKEVKSGVDSDTGSSEADGSAESDPELEELHDVSNLEGDAVTLPAHAGERCCCGCLPKPTVAWIPYIIAGADFVIAIGAGMTVQFFSLYLSEGHGLGPIATNIFWVVSPLVTAVAGSVVGQPLSKRFGRPRVSSGLQTTAVACLVVLAFDIPTIVAVPLLLLRTGLMNGAAPLKRSMLMDYVKKNERGRWNAVESLSRFSWTGSAAVGGFIIDAYDFRTCFAITACVYTVGVSFGYLLWGLVADEDAAPDDDASSTSGPTPDGKKALTSASLADTGSDSSDAGVDVDDDEAGQGVVMVPIRGATKGAYGRVDTSDDAEHP